MLPKPPTTTTDDLLAKVKAIEERAKQRRMQERLPSIPAISTYIPTPAKVVKLPIWPETARACPSCVLRSALFGVVRRGRRKYLERRIIATWTNTTIRYTGIGLDQADLDVWLTLLHIAREQGLGTEIQVTIHGLLKALGRCTGKRDHEWVKVVIARLTACTVEITMGDKTFGGSLIESFERDEKMRDYVLYLNPKLFVLFEDNTFTRIDWEQRYSLGMDLAKWLHCYILSHQATIKNPHRIGLERLRELCGSETGELWKFRQQVKEAMDELLNAGVVSNWKISANDALEIARPSRNRQILEGK